MAINFHNAQDLLRTVQDGRFRQTVDRHGDLQQVGGAQGVKGKLVAWVMAGPGREGTFAGRAVKCLVNLFDKENFETLSAALRQSRESSIDNMFKALLQLGESKLEGDYNRQFSDAARALKNFKGTAFSAVNFRDMEKTLAMQLSQQGQARQAILDTVQSGKPTPAIQALTTGEQDRALQALASARAQATDTSNVKQLTLEALATLAAQTDANPNIGALHKELTVLYRHLQGALAEAQSFHTVSNLDEQQVADLKQQIAELHDGYDKALQTLAQPRAAAHGIDMEAVVQEALAATQGSFRTAPSTSTQDVTPATNAPTRPLQHVGERAAANAQTWPTQHVDKRAATEPTSGPGKPTETHSRAELESLLATAMQDHKRLTADYETMRKGKTGKGALQSQLFRMNEAALRISSLSARIENAGKV